MEEHDKASKSLEKENTELKVMLKEFDKTNKEMGAELVQHDIA